MRCRNLAVLALILALLPALARADEWHQSFSVSGEPVLRVDTNDGNVQITSWDRPQIDARVVTSGWRISQDGVRITPTQSGNELDLTVRTPSDHWGWSVGSRWIHVELTVPRRLTLDVRTGDGNVTLAYVAGSIRLHTGDGNVQARNLDARELDAASGDGNMVVSGRFDTMTVHSGDGNVTVNAAPGSTIAMPWSLRSGDGNITLALPAGFKANLEAHTGDGEIDLAFPLSVTGKLSHSDVRGQINGGGGVLAVRTGDGSIHLTRS